MDGAKQLAEETGLQQYLPVDFWLPVTSLIAYRKKMFHHGLEWSEVERQRFHNRIADDHWPKTWFSQATSG